MDGENGGGRLVVRGRVEIDTRAPFKSVKEAVRMFGERVLVGEIYANQIKQMEESGQSQTRVGNLTAELEETKQSLEKAKEENGILSFCLQSLTDELERTKQELEKQLKATDEQQKLHRDHQLSPAILMTIHPEVDEDLKFVENEKENNKNNGEEELRNEILVQKKRNVKFATELDRTIVKKDEPMAQKPSWSPPATVKRAKKKTNLAPLIGWLFAKKKGRKYQEA